MIKRASRVMLLAVLMLVAILPVHAGASILSVSCSPTHFVVVQYTVFDTPTAVLFAAESPDIYNLTIGTGTVTTSWTGGTFNITITPATGAGDTDVITCLKPGAPGAPGTSGVETTGTGGGTPPPPPRWEGLPSDAEYDGRINATMADRYAVYCKAGELQVWDSATTRKVAAVSYDDIRALDNPDLISIGTDVSLGRSNNVLIVAGPGTYVNDGIDLERCVTGGYRGARD